MKAKEGRIVKNKKKNEKLIVMGNNNENEEEWGLKKKAFGKLGGMGGVGVDKREYDSWM